MRTRKAALATLVLVALASTAAAQDAAGAYDVTYEEVANNCAQTGIALSRGKLRISKERNQLIVDIERMPKMMGSTTKTGAVRATSKIGPSPIEKVDGKFSVAGRADAAGLQLVFVAEYYVKGTALCTQSWNVSGTREGAK